MKRCTECHSVNIRRSGVHAAEGHMHPFHSPYRCEDCNARFWVLSRKTRWGAAAGGAFVAAAVALALVPLVAHRQSEQSSLGTPARAGDDSTMRFNAPSFDDAIASQNKLRPLADPLVSDSPLSASASSAH